MKLKILFGFILIANIVFAQDKDSIQISNIYVNALNSSVGYNNLYYLCKNIGHRLCGSPEAQKAVEWGKSTMEKLGYDTVYLQKTMVKHWVRAKDEVCKVYSESMGNFNANIISLGESVGTSPDGLKTDVIEVANFEELEKLGKDKVEGKIIFFNFPMKNDFYVTFYAYGEAADYRVHGASKAAKYNAKAVIIRSLSQISSNNPHTGIMRYDEDKAKIPAFAISTSDADKLSKWIKQDSKLKIYLKSTCSFLSETESYNVIGEIRGSKNPEKIITVGGHLDSWDNTEGAHDDGVGCIHSMDVGRIFKELKIKPNNTIRTVLFMDEETNQRGGKTYAEQAKSKNEIIIAALESDAGGFTPQGFSMDAEAKQVEKLQSWKHLFEPYGLFIFRKGWGGVDIRPLKEMGVPLIGLNVDSQRYFDYQHSASDTFENVNRRQMQLGSASLASLVYLIDKYGL